MVKASSITLVDRVTTILKEAGFAKFMDGVYVSFSHGFTVSDTEDQHRVVVMYSTSTDDNEECTWGSMEERVILQAMAHILMETQYIDDGTQFDLNVLLTMNYGSWRELWVNAVQIGIG